MSDFIFYDQGSIVQIEPISEQAQQWLDDNIESEGWQWLGNRLCIDQRMVWQIIDAIEDSDELLQIVEG